MEYRTMEYREPEPGIAVVTLNRPDRLNAINFDMIDDFHLLHEDLCRRHMDVRVVILTGAGRSFCSGADLTAVMEHANNPDMYGDPAAFLGNVQKKYSRAIEELRDIPQPIIAAVHGAAAGGGMSLSLASDVVYAAPDAYFVASFLNIGLSGGELGTSYFLPRAVGGYRAREILMTGRKVHAEEAERIGLVNRVVEMDKLMDAALETARLMLTKTRMGLRLTKEVLNANLDAPSLQAAIELENRNQTICAFSKDFVQLVQLFVKK